MDPELRNIVITTGLVIIIIALFLWLFRSLLFRTGRGEEYQQDKLGAAGYETITSTRRKEYSVIGLGTLIIILCVSAIVYFGYMLFAAGLNDIFESIKLLNLMLSFIPAVIFLVLIITASRRYLNRQQLTLEEFRTFKTDRDKAISEYQAKRSGQREKKVEKRSVKQIRLEARKKKVEGLATAKKIKGKTTRH
jgi:membrane protein implicated in regulation of membrane protease activity